MMVRWWPRAMLAMLNLPMADAEAVDRAVQRWASLGEGIVRAADGGVFLLFVGAYVVEFFVDDAEGVMHVDRVRRA